MSFKFSWFRNTTAKDFHGKFKLGFQSYLIKGLLPHTPTSLRPFFVISDQNRKPRPRNYHLVSNSIDVHPDDQSALYVQNVLKFRRDKPVDEIENALNRCGLVLTDGFVLNVLRRHRSDSKPAFIFFNWVTKRGSGEGFKFRWARVFSPTSSRWTFGQLSGFIREII